MSLILKITLSVLPKIDEDCYPINCMLGLYCMDSRLYATTVLSF